MEQFKRYWGIKVLLLVLFWVFLIQSSSLRAREQWRVVDYEEITIADTATYLTVAKYYTASTNKILSDYAVGYLKDAQVNFRLDGTNPTSSVGTTLEIGQLLYMDTYDKVQKARFIRTGGTSGKLCIHYFKWYGN